MSRLYKRQARLTVARQSLGLYFSQLPNAMVIEDLRMQIVSVKDLDTNPNSCTIIVTNMSKFSRGELEFKPLHVTVEAGYEDSMKQLFVGNARHVQSRLVGMDWETTIECGDGARAITNARVNMSFKSGVTTETVLGHLAGSFGVTLPSSKDQALDLSKQFAAGYSSDGPSSDQMTKVLAPFEKSWSIQDGSWQILGDSDVREGTAFVINSSSGMLGTPVLNQSTKPGEPATLTVSNLLYPELSPGRKLKLESVSVEDGLFRIKKVEHRCDTDGADWTTNIEATPL